MFCFPKQKTTNEWEKEIQVPTPAEWALSAVPFADAAFMKR
jgi:hypothetical protein